MRDLIITAVGEALVAGLVGGDAKARFTKICASCKDYSELGRDGLRELSALDGICQSAAVSGTRRVDGSVVEITAAMDNTGLEAGYYTRALGVYAEGGDGSEILFAVCAEGGSPFYMPPFSGGTVSGISYKLRVKVSDSGIINVGASSDVYATAFQLDNEVKRINERIDGLSFSEEISGHNESEDSHPKLLELLSGISGRLELVEIAAGEGVIANPFAVTFGTLDGISADGVWNAAKARIEF